VHSLLLDDGDGGQKEGELVEKARKSYVEKGNKTMPSVEQFKSELLDFKQRLENHKVEELYQK